LTGAAATTVQSGTGDLALTSTDAITLDCAGVLELNSTAGVIGIGNDADAQNINIGTGAAARTLTLGNATGATSVVVDVGTGACNIATSATAHATTVGSTTAGATLELQTPTGTYVVADEGVSITTAGRGLSLPGGVLVLAGADTPNGAVTAPVGSLFLRTNPGNANERLYVNTDAGTTWVHIAASA
jgi:hypothetical protein